jgi:TonB family protein
MNALRGSIEVEEWRPPAVKPAREPSAITGTLRRGLLVLAVLALHAAALVLFALPRIIEGARESSPDGSRTTLALVELESSGSELVVVTTPAPLAEAVIELPTPVLPEAPAPDESEVAPASSNEFRPPRLRPHDDTTLPKLVASAGLRVAKASRVILTVSVSAEGIAGEIAIAISSGNAALDSLAIEYARIMRWEPAIVDGREAAVSIRLPVVFPATG